VDSNLCVEQAIAGGARGSILSLWVAAFGFYPVGGRLIGQLAAGPAPAKAATVPPRAAKSASRGFATSRVS
jgi:hypothetical protein